MQPLGDVLQRDCPTLLLKKQLNYTYEKLHRSIFYNRSRATALCLDSEFQTVEVISQGSRGPDVQTVQGNRGPGGPESPWDLGILGVLGVPRSQDWVPLFYHALHCFGCYFIWKNCFFVNCLFRDFFIDVLNLPTNIS